MAKVRVRVAKVREIERWVSKLNRDEWQRGEMSVRMRATDG